MSTEDELRARIAALETELAQVKAEIGAVIAGIPAILYVKDAEHRYRYGSPYGFAMFGVDSRRAIGHTDADLFPPELAARFRASDDRVRAAGALANDSYSVPTAKGPRHFAGVRFVVPIDGNQAGVCGFAIDVTERIEMEKELERLATTDALTGIANRRRFDAVLEAEIARAARNGHPLSLLLCDVDHFKRYNDTYGHQRGDTCLESVARALTASLRRPADLATRHGGEEFALILPDTSLEGAAHVAERISAAVRALAIPHVGNDQRGVVTVSTGCASIVGAWTADELVALADEALYEAKGRGRDRHSTRFGEHPPASARAGRSNNP